jgi:YD repeat-containing protein
MLVEGSGGAEVSVAEKNYNGKDEICIEIKRFRWDRLFADPHSMELDFSDACYLGGVWWMDYDDALEKWPDAQDALDATLENASNSDTFDDKPQYNVWADRKRKRLRIVQIWVKKGETWHFAEFTKGGILKDGPSPYKTDHGESDCGLFAQSAYVSKDGERYGIVREMISPQDEINKRRSKGLHYLNTAQVITTEDAISGENGADIERVRKEAARPDGVIVLNPGHKDDFEFQTRIDLARGHVEFLQEAKAEIDLMGPNASMQGDNGNDASGRAIMASQQGGMIEMGDLLDNLRYFDKRIYRAVWNRIRQYWTGERWIRVTDDERNVRFSVINQPAYQTVEHPDVGQFQVPQIDPQTGQQAITNNVAESQVDIIIDDAPDTIAPQIEQWQALVEAMKVLPPNAIPADLLIELAPNLKNKDRILDRLTQHAQEMAQQPDPDQQKVQAQMALLQQKAQIDAQKGQQELELGQQKAAQEAALHQQKMAHTVEKARVDGHVQIAKAQIDGATQRQAAQQKLALGEVEARQKMAVQGATARQGLAIKGETARQGLNQKKAQGDAALRDKRKLSDMEATHKAVMHEKEQKAAPDDGKFEDLESGQVEIISALKAVQKDIKAIGNLPRALRTGMPKGNKKRGFTAQRNAQGIIAAVTDESGRTRKIKRNAAGRPIGFE